jgi:hypothetical protein
MNSAVGRAAWLAHLLTSAAKLPYTPAAWPLPNSLSALSPSKQKTATAASSDQPRKLISTVVTKAMRTSNKTPNHNALVSSHKQIQTELLSLLLANVDDGNECSLNQEMRAQCYKEIEKLFLYQQNTASAASSDQPSAF